MRLPPHSSPSRGEIAALSADLSADRASTLQAWIQGLARAGLPLCVRLRQDTFIDDLPASNWRPSLQPGMPGILVDQADVVGQPMNVVPTRTHDRETLIIASNAGPADCILGGYRKGFRIGCVFHALKSNGVKLEHTHMTLHVSPERLLCLHTLAYGWCVLVGVLQTCAVKAHGRRAWSVVILGLGTLVSTFTRIVERGVTETCSSLGS